MSYSSSRITKKQLQCGHLSSIVNNCGTTASKLLQLGQVANTSFVLKTEAEFSSDDDGIGSISLREYEEKKQLGTGTRKN